MLKFQSSVLIALLVFSSSSTALADGWDYNASFGARSLPIGASFFGDGGYGITAWGEKTKDQFIFGYVRPNLRVATSALVDNGDLGVDLYPISFLGVRLGSSLATRNVTLDTLDCSLVACGGTLGRNSIETKLTLGAAGYFMQATAVYENQTPSIKSVPYADEVASLAGRTGGDQLLKNELIVGREFDGGYVGGLHFSAARMIASGANNDEQSLVGGYKKGRWTYLAGAGAYESSTQSRSLSMFALFSWSGIPKIGF